MRARHLRIRGRVQGVGFREWLMWEARRVGVHGWVRNRQDGSLEAVVAGEEVVLRALLLRCRAGPPLARVDSLEETFCEDPEEVGFHRRPTA